MKVHNGLATYHDGGAAAVNRRCAMWLPTFLQRGIHFFGERPEVLAFNNFVLFNRVHLLIIGKRAAEVEGGIYCPQCPVNDKLKALNFSGFFMLDPSLALRLKTRTVGCLR
jgi:hypothetical protein